MIRVVTASCESRDKEQPNQHVMTSGDNGGMGEPPHPPPVFYVTQRLDRNDNKETSEVFVLSI